MPRHLRGKTKPCPHCDREISRYPLTRFPLHKTNCPERPSESQAQLGRWSA